MTTPLMPGYGMDLPGGQRPDVAEPSTAVPLLIAAAIGVAGALGPWVAVDRVGWSHSGLQEGWFWLALSITALLLGVAIRVRMGSTLVVSAAIVVGVLLSLVTMFYVGGEDVTIAGHLHVQPTDVSFKWGVWVDELAGFAIAIAGIYAVRRRTAAARQRAPH